MCVCVCVLAAVVVAGVHVFLIIPSLLPEQQTNWLIDKQTETDRHKHTYIL